MYIVYFLIVLIADIIGSFSGMGGSLFIKPLISIVSSYPLEVVIFCANLAVLTMVFSSLCTNLKTKVIKMTSSSYLLIFGSLLGGLIGGWGLDALFLVLPRYVKVLQNSLIIFFLVLAIIYQLKGKPIAKPFKQKIAFFLVGLFCGATSILLGIGGGPINVFILLYLMGMTLKEATSYSLLSVFTAILIRTITSLNIVSYYHIPLSLILCFVGAAFLGGIIGELIKKYMANKKLKIIYIFTLLLAIVINLVNIWY